ncbi:MAG TPA: glycosyltransferase, partial [Caldilineaceae bacterium]|nr:glycosyltransferase [Caldilineaceae bacterium]
MKILLVGQAYYRRDSGQAVFTINLAEGLAAVGHQVLVLAPSLNGHAERWQAHGVTVQTAPAWSLIDNANITLFSGGLVEQTMATFQPDLVHLQDHYFLSHSVLTVAYAHHLLAVGTNHFLPENLSDNLPFAHWAHKPLDQMLWSTMTMVYNQLQAVATPTETAAAILRTQGIHVPVTAISCGVDVHRFQPRPGLERSPIRKRYGLAPDKITFCYIGRLAREKDLGLMIRAFAQLDRQDIQLAIGGKGGIRP